ncbi:hypothetical protein CBR_g66721 [Chara braunii]|uniref:Reverse transcriptase domain-containing protein n=1 Tax=Chara braunii TaxID=69332 RepID=A0A388JQ48_CHABU|nr:hypothetical protein CBR_g66721 [Chara braunii]|eukprot:GBG59915.1 hypothetical protein CBR_g66721 [Chara braunii]
MSTEQDTGALPRRSARIAVRARPAVPPRPKKLSRRTTPAASSMALTVQDARGDHPTYPVRGANEPAADYRGRLLAFSEAVAAVETRKEIAEAERQRLANEAAAEAQRTTETDAATRDRRNASSTESLIACEHLWTTVLQDMIFSHLRADVTQRQTYKNDMTTLTTAIRTEAMQQQQQHQLLNSTVTRVNSIEANASAAPGCTTDVTKQLNERIDHVVTIIGDISTFTGPDSISSTVGVIKTDLTKLQTRPEAATKTFKMPHFDISKFDDYNKSDALSWWQRFLTEASCRMFTHFIRQDDVTFFMVDVTDLLHYDPPCPDAELIPLEPDPPSISMASISTSIPPPSVESTPPSHADADAEELARYTADFEPAVHDLIREYHDVFPSSFSYAGIPPMRYVEHSIQLVPDYRVHHQAPYRLSIPEATELKRQLEELLRLGFIKPSNSPWGAPVLFARKADGTLRLCIDYRGLNRYTVKNSYPIPRSDELFDRLAGNRSFTKIDLRSGYHQIRVAAADQPKTAFRSRFGHYEFTVMPFGLTNAPATFQRTMNDIFRDILEQYVIVYLDDILVYSRTLKEHLRHLHDVLDRLRRHGFYAKLSKCHFAQHKVDFLGHYVSDQGLHMDDAKITAIAEWLAPTSAKQLRSFLGLTSYYSNFIRGYASVKSRSGDCPIAFYSQQLLPAEINYTADEREVLAVVYAARHWRHYLHGAPFMVRTDNSVVQAFLTKPKLTPRQARWWRDLSEFSFTTEHIKDETNRVADALSRRPDHDQEHIQLSSISVNTVHHSVIDEFRTQYRHCPDYRDIHATLRSGKTVPNYSLRDNGLVYWHGSQGTREPRICVPSTRQLRVRAVAEFHDQAAAGHMGFHKTLARVSRLYVWPKRKDFVKDYVAECPTCQEVNSANHLPYGLLQPLPIAEGRWQSISMDFIGPLRPPTPRGHDAILVVVDRFTKRARFVPCRYAISAREVADIVFD